MNVTGSALVSALVSDRYPAERWRELFDLLSMDVVVPFYEMMGLRAFSRLPQVLRKEIVSERRTMASPGSQPPLDEILAAVERSLGMDAGRQLVWWGQHVFHWDPRDHMNLENWASILNECRQRPELSRRLFPQDTVKEAMTRFKEASELDDYERLQETVDARPLSEWDLHIYALRLYDDNLYPPARAMNMVPDGPRLYVPTTIRSHRRYEFWNWVLKQLRPNELDRTLKEGTLIAQEEELTWVKDLPHPSVFEVRP